MNRRFAITLLLGSLAALGWRDAHGAGRDAGPNAQKPARSAKAWPPLPQSKPHRPGARAVIVLDPGHGGRDPGAIGARGTREKNVTLAICNEIKRTLARAGGPKVVLTRDGDEFLSLPQRIEVAHRAEADLFVSIHADAASNRAARGVSAYTLAEKASDEMSAALAAQENRVDLIYGVDLRGADQQTAAILIDLARRHSHNSALIASRKLIDQLEGRLRLLENPLRAADFAVLKSPQIPSLLIETGFLSNSDDERMLAAAKGRATIAAALSRALSGIASDIKNA